MSVDPAATPELIKTHFEPYYLERRVYGDPQSPKLKTVFHLEQRFQLFSAGRDKKFGGGGPWPLRIYPGQVFDKDNLTNFAEARLEIGR